jgi:hypothetical protein
MTPAEIAASFELLSKSGASVDEWNRWYSELAKPAQQGAGPQRVTDEQYAAMTGAEKFAYARGFQQQPLDHGRRKP